MYRYWMIDLYVLLVYYIMLLYNWFLIIKILFNLKLNGGNL